MGADGSREELAGAGPALFRVVRFWARRWAMHASVEVTGDERRVQDVVVVEAVDSAARLTEEVSINDVAYHLGIDHSGASRFVAAAINDGYLQRTASSTDRRRAVLVVTPAGRELLTGAHAWQEDVFTDLTAGWPPADAARFAGYLRRLADELAAH